MTCWCDVSHAVRRKLWLPHHLTSVFLQNASEAFPRRSSAPRLCRGSQPSPGRLQPLLQREEACSNSSDSTATSLCWPGGCCVQGLRTGRGERLGALLVTWKGRFCVGGGRRRQLLSYRMDAHSTKGQLRMPLNSAPYAGVQKSDLTPVRTSLTIFRNTFYIKEGAEVCVWSGRAPCGRVWDHPASPCFPHSAPPQQQRPRLESRLGVSGR